LFAPSGLRVPIFHAPPTRESEGGWRHAKFDRCPAWKMAVTGSSRQDNARPRTWPAYGRSPRAGALGKEESVMGVAKKAKRGAKSVKGKAKKDTGKVKHKGKKAKNAAKH